MGSGKTLGTLFKGGAGRSNIPTILAFVALAVAVVFSSSTILKLGAEDASVASGNVAEAATKTEGGPFASFSVESRRGLYVQFRNSGTGEIASYEWNFGDGSSATEKNPAHLFHLAGSYRVTLKVTDAAGATDTFTRSVYVSGERAARKVALEPTQGEDGSYTGRLMSDDPRCLAKATLVLQVQDGTRWRRTRALPVSKKGGFDLDLPAQAGSYRVVMQEVSDHGVLCEGYVSQVFDVPPPKLDVESPDKSDDSDGTVPDDGYSAGTDTGDADTGTTGGGDTGGGSDSPKCGDGTTWNPEVGQCTAP